MSTLPVGVGRNDTLLLYQRVILLAAAILNREMSGMSFRRRSESCRIEACNAVEVTTADITDCLEVGPWMDVAARRLIFSLQ